MVLVPTRELAKQVAEVFTPLAAAVQLRVTTVFGGVGQGSQCVGDALEITRPPRSSHLRQLHRGHPKRPSRYVPVEDGS